MSGLQDATSEPGLVSALEPDEVLLTRAEASAYLLTLGIRMKPGSLARAFSMRGDGPPCVHIRRKPYYPRGVLLQWAAKQMTGLRSSSSEPPAAAITPERA